MKILDAVTATGAGDIFPPGKAKTPGQRGVVQALITGATDGSNSVILEGSLDRINWIPVSSPFTDSLGEEITLMSFLRGNVTDFADGEITLMIED